MEMPEVRVAALTKKRVNTAFDQVCASIYEVAEMVEGGEGGGNYVDLDTFQSLVTQVQSLESDVNTLSGLVNQAVDNVANLTGSVNSMGSAIDTLSSDLQELVSRVTALENA